MCVCFYNDEKDENKNIEFIQQNKYQEAHLHK